MSDRLELCWPHKGEHVLQNPDTGRWEFCGNGPLPFCPLIELETYGAERQKPFADEHSNLLIRGENLFALRVLQRTHAGKVKLVYIDPPFNTGGDFDAYSDSFQHSVWLSMMHERLVLIRNLLRDDGVLFVQLDDTEHGYLRVLLDEVFGGMRRTRGGLWQGAFIANVIWQKAFSPRNNARHFSVSHDNLLVYAKDPEQCRINLLPRTEEQNGRYDNPDHDLRGPWSSSDLLASLTSGQRGRQFQRTGRSPNLYMVTAPSGREISPPKNRCWAVSQERFEELNADGRIWWGENGNNVPALKRFLSEVQQGVIPQTIWLYEEVGHNQEAQREIKQLFPNEPLFPTPKPERLMQRIIELGSSPGDLVLDCFAGSGTTGAVAHRLGRRWIMGEINGQAETLCKRRLQGEVDQQTTVLEMGDGRFCNGFRYLEVGAPLLVPDPETQLTILNPHYKNAKLVRVVCQLEGFALTGDEEHFHGRKGAQLAHVTEDFVDDSYVRRLTVRLPEGHLLTVYGVKFQRGIQPPRHVSLKRLQTELVEPYLTEGVR